MVRRIVAASLRLLEPNVARGDGDDGVAVSGREGDVAVVAGSVDMEVVRTDDWGMGEGGVQVFGNALWYYRLVWRSGVSW